MVATQSTRCGKKPVQTFFNLDFHVTEFVGKFLLIKLSRHVAQIMPSRTTCLRPVFKEILEC